MLSIQSLKSIFSHPPKILDPPGFNKLRDESRIALEIAYPKKTLPQDRKRKSDERPLLQQ